MKKDRMRLTRFEIERRADPNDRTYLQASAPYVVFRYALDHGWVTQAEYEAEREHYGRYWTTRGD